MTVKLVMLIAALLLILAGCSSGVGGPRPSSENYIEPPPAVAPAPALRPGPAPIGVGLPGVGRVTAPPPRRCKIKEKTVVQNGRKRVTRYQVCK